MKKEKKNTTLVDRTLDHTSPQFYPGVYVALVTLLSSLSCANLRCRTRFWRHEETENPSSKHYE